MNERKIVDGFCIDVHFLFLSAKKSLFMLMHQSFIVLCISFYCPSTQIPYFCLIIRRHMYLQTCALRKDYQHAQLIIIFRDSIVSIYKALTILVAVYMHVKGLFFPGHGLYESLVYHVTSPLFSGLRHYTKIDIR